MPESTFTVTFGELMPGDEFYCAGMRWIKTGINRGLPLLDVDIDEDSLDFEPDVIVEKAAES